MIDDFCTAIEFESMRDKFKQDLCAMVSRAQTLVDDHTNTTSLQPVAPRYK